MKCRVLSAAAVVVLLPSLAAAQAISGVLLQPDSVTPAAGVIVVASRPANDSLLARTITSGNGRYVLTLAAGPVRLRALRIGHRPFVVATVTLGANERRELRTVLPSTPIVLSAVTTRGTTSCRQTGAAGEAVAAVFEEARKALISTQLTSSDARPVVRISHFYEQRSLGNRSQSRRQHEFSEGASLRPFESLTPDSLARVGYVQSDAVGTTYWAPDADVLLSEPFAAAHCMDLTDATADGAGWIGLTFRPAKRPAGRVDVRGTLWLDRGTSELRRMEYWYVGQPPELQAANPGGTVEFTRLADGFWFINAWEIRMPRMLQQLAGARATGVSVRGGEVWRVRRGDDLVFTNGEVEPAPKVAAGIAAKDEALPGEDGYVPADTTAIPLPCEHGASGVAVGMLHGKVRDDRGAPLGDAVVSAEWQESHRATGGQFSSQTRQLTAVAARDGYFVVCGVPRGVLVTVVAQYGTRKTPKVALRLAEREVRARVDLRVRGVRRDAPARP